MPLIHLPHRLLIAVTGEDAEHFLEGLITSELPDGQSVVGSALLTPQGKLLFTFLVSRTTDGFLIECDANEPADIIKRLTLYKLRAKVVIAPLDEPVHVGGSTGLADQRHRDMGMRLYGAANATANATANETANETANATDSVDAYTALRASLGLLEGPQEVIANQDFPHDVALDLTGAISFSKGCFVGQEVVSRVKHRGTARRRPVLVKGEGIEAGASLFVGEREVGTIRLAAGSDGVAVVRLDHIAGKDVHIASVDGALGAVAAPPYATYSLEAEEQAD